MTARILVLPGIGDIYWITVALEGFRARHGLGEIELHVWDFDGRRRGQEFVQRVPFVKSGGYHVNKPHPAKLPEFQDSYLTGKRSSFRGFHGFDFYLAVNGALRTGRTIEQALGCETEWTFPLRRTARELAAQATYEATYGEYIVAHFSDFGIFKPWVKAWPLEDCALFVREIYRATGARVLLTGCTWDRPFSLEIQKHTGGAAVLLAGATNPDQFYGLLHGAKGVVGWCGGNTILATALGKPTWIGWSQKAFPDPRFFRNSCPPDTWNRTYKAGIVEHERPATAARRFLDALEEAA